MKNQLIHLGSDHPELRPHIRAILSSTDKIASLDEDPVGHVLDQYWNVLHDFETDLEWALGEYEVAASYSGGAGKQDADKVVKEIKNTISALEGISMRQLGKLYDAASNFTRKHGEPSEYVDAQRKSMFPR